MSAVKRRLREDLRADIAGFPEEYISLSDEKIFLAVSELSEFESARCLFVYCSADREPCTRKIISLALCLGKTVALPLIKGAGAMEARAVNGFGELETGPYGGILQPQAKAPLVPPGSLDLIIVPALAFDKTGIRLGQGGGYYDRFLTDTAAFTVGLCRHRLFFDSLPREEHDIPVKCVVTEKEIARL